MAITITRDDVKRKCMIDPEDTTYDSHIDDLIAEMQPAVEYTIADCYLSLTGDTGLQKTLELGILEVISGEFLEQLSREIGAAEEFEVGSITIGERKERGHSLITQGMARLAPYLKSMQPVQSESASQVAAPEERMFDLFESAW